MSISNFLFSAVHVYVHKEGEDCTCSLEKSLLKLGVIVLEAAAPTDK